MTDDIDNDGTTLHESGEVVQPTDARLVTLNAQQQALLHRMLDWHAAVVRFGAESPSAFKHFAACAALAVPQAPLQAEPVPVVASEVLKELIAASDEQDRWRMSHPALRQHLSTEEAHRIGDRVDKAWIAARRVAVLATPQAEPAQKADK